MHPSYKNLLETEKRIEENKTHTHTHTHTHLQNLYMNYKKIIVDIVT